MNIVLLGSILDYGRDVWESIQPTPEVTLLDGLALRGHNVAHAGLHRLLPVARLSWDYTDVVHMHHLGRAGFLLSSLRPRTQALVYTPHSSSPSPVGEPRTRRLARLRLHQRMMRKADAVVALSPAEAAVHLAMAADSQVRVAVVPNGVAVGPFRFTDRRVPQPPDPWQLLYVGQLAAFKRVDLLIRAVAELSGTLPVRLRLVYHNDALEYDLRSLAGRLDVEDRVDFVGRLSGERLAAEYRTSHILLLPSENYEALPSVVTEGMYTGIPVVASDVGGVRWQLGGWGRCIPAADSHALLAAIGEIVSEYPAEMLMSKGAAASARSRFSVEGMLSNHEQLYQGLISHRVIPDHLEFRGSSR